MIQVHRRPVRLRWTLRGHRVDGAAIGRSQHPSGGTSRTTTKCPHHHGHPHLHRRQTAGLFQRPVTDSGRGDETSRRVEIPPGRRRLAAGVRRRWRRRLGSRSDHRGWYRGRDRRRSARSHDAQRVAHRCSSARRCVALAVEPMTLRRWSIPADTELQPWKKEKRSDSAER